MKLSEYFPHRHERTLQEALFFLWRCCMFRYSYKILWGPLHFCENYLKTKTCWWWKSYDVLDYGSVFMTIKHILLLKSDYYKVKKTHSHYCNILPLCIKLIFRKTMLQWKRLQSFYYMHMISFFSIRFRSEIWSGYFFVRFTKGPQLFDTKEAWGLVVVKWAVLKLGVASRSGWQRGACRFHVK